MSIVQVLVKLLYSDKEKLLLCPLGLYNFDIQGVPGGKDLTSGECSLGQTITI